MPLKNKKIAVVGAGISGLAAAYRLKEQGATVVNFERCDYVGGRTRSVRLGDFTFDVGALVMLPTYKNAYAFIKELGIDNHIHETKPSLAIMKGGVRHSFDYGHPIKSALSIKLLSWSSKLKMLKLLPLMARNWSKFNYASMGDISHLDDESTRDFCLRFLNEEIDDYLANPFIRINSLTNTRTAPYGEWLWQLSAYKSPHIFQLDKGMAFYAETLGKDLDIQLSTAVSNVSSENGKAVVTYSNSNGEQTETYDACIMACPPPFAHKIAPSVTPQQERFFSNMKPVCLITLHIGLDYRPDIDDSIIMFPEKESADIIDILMDHNKSPGRAPDGKAAIAIQTSMQWSEAHMDANDEEILDKLVALVEPYIGKIKGHIEVSYVNRWDYVCPVTTPGHYRALEEYLTTRNLDQPLFFCGDFFSGGVEGATLSGLNAYRDVERYLS